MVAGRPFLASDGNLAGRVVRADSTWRSTAVIDSTGTLRYLGQFRARQQVFAHDALKAVLAGTEIAIKVTRSKG